MHAEYAVEPAAIGADWETFRYLIDKFGLDKGRLISRMPKEWEATVVQAAKEAGITEIKLASIVERLRTGRKIRLFDFHREYRSEKTWIENAVREHAARPFHAIIYAGATAPCANALAPDQCDEENGLFIAPISRAVARSADALADALLLLAVAAREIDIVDPYFDLRPGKGHFIGTLASLLAKLEASGSWAKVIRIHFRTHDSRPPGDLLLRDTPRHTQGIIPTGYVLELNEWSEIQGGEDFHDRYFLTDAGGITIGAGLSADGAAETTTFTLLDDRHAQTVRARFSAKATAYTRVGSAVRIDSTGKAEFV